VEEACSDSEAESIGVGERVARQTNALFLDLLVWVVDKPEDNQQQTKRTAPKKSGFDFVRMEVLLIVEKHEDETYQISSTPQLSSFEIEKATLESLGYGQVRSRIADHIMTKCLDGYTKYQDDELVLYFGQHSVIFIPVDYQKKKMQKLTKMAELASAIKKRAKMSNVIKIDNEGTRVLPFHSALGRTKKNDNQYSELDKGDQVNESQMLTYNSPATVDSKKRAKRSATASVFIDTEQLINDLYWNEDSPYFHGFSQQMCSRIRARCTDQRVADILNARREKGEWPTAEELLREGLTPEEHPVGGAYPPYLGQPPSVATHPTKTPIGELSSVLSKLIELRVTPVTTTVATPSNAPQSNAPLGRCYFRFRKMDALRWTDVMIQSELLKEYPSFTGKNLLKIAQQKANKIGSGTFSFTADEIRMIQLAKAQVFISRKGGGVQFDLTQFKALQKEDFLIFIDGQNECVKFDVEVLEVVQGESIDLLAL